MLKATKSDRAPGPPGRFLIGCLKEFRQDPIELMQRATHQYGDLVQLKIGPVLVHLVNRPDYIKYVLVEHARNYDKRTRSVAKIRATCGQSLLSADGKLWQRHRQLIQPAFQRESVHRFVDLIADATREMLDRWSEAAQGGCRLDVVSEMMKVTLTIAARSLFGAEIQRDAEVVEHCLEVILDDTWQRLQNWFDLASIHPALHRSKFKHARRRIDDIVFRMIRARRNQGGDPNDLLSILIRAHDTDDGARLSDQELRDACVSLLLAGHETTANALAWSFLLIAQAPQVEQQIRVEAHSVLRSGALEPTDVEKLCYADHSFAEAIRLYPSIWVMERRVVADDWIDGYRLPSDSTVLISPYLLHRHPEYWPDPEKFDPDRFSSSEIQTRPKYAYLPFGAGPHQCIGRHLATLVGRLVLAMTYQRFHLRAPSVDEGTAKEPGRPTAPRDSCHPRQHDGAFTGATGSKPRFLPAAGITLRHRQRLQMVVVENGAKTV